MLISCSTAPTKEERAAYYQAQSEVREAREIAKKNKWTAESKEKCASYGLVSGELNRCIDEKVERLEAIDREKAKANRAMLMQMYTNKKRKQTNCDTYYGGGYASTTCQ